MKTATSHMIRQILQSALQDEIAAFLVDRRARGLSRRTIQFYGEELRHWHIWAQVQGIRDLQAITPRNLRAWLVKLGERRNPGGVHASYRALRAFLRWAWEENDLPPPCPIKRVAAPKVPKTPLSPVPIADLSAMIATCQRRRFLGDRDRAIMVGLLDTGCRAGEFVALNLGDVAMSTGRVWIREGKGGKQRAVFFGPRTLKEITRYLRHRPDRSAADPLWITHRGRLAYGGLRAIMRKRARLAQVPAPSLHSFRRAFALYSLRAGMDVYSLQRLMGHESLAVLRRYLCQNEDDLRVAHKRAGLVDSLL